MLGKKFLPFYALYAALQADRYAESDPKNAKFSFFDITPYGIIYAIFGFIYTVLASLFFLPNDDTTKHSDLLFVARVPPLSPVVGRTIKEAGLTVVERLHLLAVERQVRVNIICLNN